MQHATVSDEVRQTIGRALGRVPSGIFIMTAVGADGTPIAMLTSWAQQAGFQPPAVSVAVGKDRPIASAVRASGRFALSIVPAEGGTPLMKKYARGIPEDQDPFQGMATKLSPAGIPVLADALAYLECRVLSTCDFGGDHELVVGEVTAGELLREGDAFTHTRGNGFHY